MARPQPTEHAPYYSKYIELVPEGDILGVLRAQTDETLEILRSEEHTSELQSQSKLVCRLLLEKKKRRAVSQGGARPRRNRRRQDSRQRQRGRRRQPGRKGRPRRKNPRLAHDHQPRVKRSRTRAAPQRDGRTALQSGQERSQPRHLIRAVRADQDAIALPRARHRRKQRPQRRDLFFFNDTATTEIYTLSLHDALPI